MRPDSDRVADMLDAIAAVWMLRHIQIIGEAAAGITRETRALAGTIPWGQIVGMRNALVHACWCTPAGARLLQHRLGCRLACRHQGLCHNWSPLWARWPRRWRSTMTRRTPPPNQ